MLSKLSRLPGLGAQRPMLVLALTAVAVTAACAAIVIVQTRSNIQAQVFKDQAALGQSYALVVQEYLHGSRSILEGLAQVPAVRAPLRLDAIRPELRGIPQDVDTERRAAIAGTISGSGRVRSMIMVAPGGELYLAEPYTSQLAFPSPKLTTPPIVRALATGQTVFSDVIHSALTRLPTIALQVPIKDDAGVVQGLIGTTVELAQLAEVAQGIRPGTTGSVMLFDRYGLPIVYPDSARVLAARPLTDMPLVQQALAGRTGPSAYNNPVTSQEELGTAVALDNGWFAMVTQTQAEAYAGLNQTTATLLAVLGVGVAAVLAAGVLLAISVVMRARLALRTADHERAEEALQHQALHDKLTGLPNRTVFRSPRAGPGAGRPPGQFGGGPVPGHRQSAAGQR
jgi:hypothetical protein